MARENGEAAMICPACGSELETMVRQGVEIERCTNCRGVWLDRGELEKLVAIGVDQHGEPAYEQPLDEESQEPEPADKLATRRSFFAELFEDDRQE